MSQQRVDAHIKDMLQMKVHLLMYVKVSRKHMAKHAPGLCGVIQRRTVFTLMLAILPFQNSSDLHYRSLLDASTNYHVSWLNVPPWLSAFRFAHDMAELSRNSSLYYLTLTVL